MATAVSARPAPPTQHQKLKRPPPSAVQTSINGVKSSQSSPSPSLSSKRPPSGFQHPQKPGATGGSISANLAAARAGNRRRESQKPGDNGGRPSRTGKGAAGEGMNGERRTGKRICEPLVKTTPYMLKKYRKAPPSLVLHLHPTHFRFDQQDGSFSYNSSMKILLEHIKSQTVPHDMLEELKQAGIRFYENCLIVQIQDHRTNSATSQTTSSIANQDKNIPFSIHNYNEHLTPSPYVPYPKSKVSGRNENGQAPTGPRVTGSDIIAQEAEQSNEPASGQVSGSTTSDPSKGPKIFTTVLFSTPKSLDEDIITMAHMLDGRSTGRKQSQINARPPPSATLSHPPTPSSAVPPTPTSYGPPTKKQKLLFTGNDLAAAEGKLIAATAPPLFLDPVDCREDALELLLQLQDPLFCSELPAQKTRKRTVRELEADEALAAAEQQFMLIMDERLVPSATGTGASNATATDGDTSAASFEPRFERFKAIEEIKLALQEKAHREAEVKAQQVAHQQAAKARQDQQQREALADQQRIAQARREKELHIRQLQSAQIAQHNHQMMQQQHHLPLGANQHAHPQTSNAMMQNSHSLAVSQAHHSSPVIRNMTPHNNSSPLVGNSIMSHGSHGVPMNATSSNQGTGSPPRPGSTVQHGHPPGPAGMTNQRSQQPPSRNGTPQMPNGTPRLPQSTPVMRNVTPTPRMSHASPGSSAMAATPVIGHSMMPTPVMNGQHLTPQQQHMFQQQQQQQRQNAMAQHQAMQGSPQNGQAGQNLQQQAAHRAQQQQAQIYRQQLQNMTHQQMSNVAAGNSQYAGSSMGMQSQNQMPMPPQTPQQLQATQANMWEALGRKIMRDTYNNLLAGAQSQYGANVPGQVVQNLKDQAVNQAKILVQRRKHEHFARQQQMQRAAMMGQMPNGGMTSGAMNGMNGVNGR